MGDKKDAIKSFLTENVLGVIIEYGKEAAKARIKDVVTNDAAKLAAAVGIDMAGSIIPGIGSAISAYRTQRQLNNLNTLVSELNKKVEEIKLNFERQTEENKKTLDAIFEMVIYKAVNTNQSEKIKYMVNGYANLTAIQNVSYDISYLFYDVLDRMTILDIAVLKASYPFWGTEENRKSFVDVLNEFGIDYYQYEAVRDNLYRMGLLENQYDDALEKDLDLLVKNVNNLNEVVISIQESLANPRKKMKKLKNTKVELKAKDRLKISKFGREFVEFFIKNYNDNVGT